MITEGGRLHLQGNPLPARGRTRRSGSSSRAPGHRQPSAAPHGGRARGFFWRCQGHRRPPPVQDPQGRRGGGPRPPQGGGGQPRRVFRRGGQNSERPIVPRFSGGPGGVPAPARVCHGLLRVLVHSWQHHHLERLSALHEDSAFDPVELPPAPCPEATTASPWDAAPAETAEHRCGAFRRCPGQDAPAPASPRQGAAAERSSSIKTWHGISPLLVLICA